MRSCEKFAPSPSILDDEDVFILSSIGAALNSVSCGFHAILTRPGSSLVTKTTSVYFPVKIFIFKLVYFCLCYY